MSYVVTVNPCPTKFVGDMIDMIISTDETSLNFELLYAGECILSENYIPAQGTVRIGGLNRVIDGVLRGLMLIEGGQDYYSGYFNFYIGGTLAFSRQLYLSHCQNIRDVSGIKFILSHANKDICYPGKLHPITFIGDGTNRYTATLYDANGNVLDEISPGYDSVPFTQNCNPSSLFPLSVNQGAKIVYTCSTDTFTSYIDHTSYPDAMLFRFLNMYDLPETLLAKKVTTVKPAYTDEIANINGVKTRFGIETNDEYTADSGALMFADQYLQWHDLMMSRQVEVFYEDEWFPIVVTKTNYQQFLRKGSLDNVQFSFRMANNLQLIL